MRVSTNGNRILTVEERQVLRDLVELERRVRAGLPIPEGLRSRIEWERHVAESRARRDREERRLERRFRERRLALDRGYLCVDCEEPISLSAGEKATKENRPIRCRGCSAKIEGKRRRRYRRRCRVCRKGISHATFTKAIREGREPRCRECRYAAARVEPPPLCSDCGERRVSKNHWYQVRKKGGKPRCHPCGQAARREREKQAA